MSLYRVNYKLYKSKAHNLCPQNSGPQCSLYSLHESTKQQLHRSISLRRDAPVRVSSTKCYKAEVKMVVASDFKAVFPSSFQAHRKLIFFSPRKTNCSPRSF